jgi:hypothetical protein
MAWTFRRSVFGSTLAEAWPLWLAICGVGLAWLIGYALAQDLKHQVLYAGVVLEIFGIINVAVGVADVRRSFSRPSFTTVVRSWFRQLGTAFVTPPTSVVTPLEGRGSLSMVGHRVRLEVRAGQGSSVEHRLALVEREMDELWKGIDDQAEREASAVAQLKSAISAERLERTRQLDTLAKKTEDLAVGGVRLELIGIAWLTVGCVCAGVNEEIAAILLPLRGFF